jgi:hypothetical protein
MSERVYALMKSLEEKGYELKNKVTIAGHKTKASEKKGYPTFSLRPKEETFKANEKERIDEFFSKFSPIASVTFTTEDRVKLNYEQTSNNEWMLRGIGIGPLMIGVNGIEDVLKLHI